MKALIRALLRMFGRGQHTTGDGATCEPHDGSEVVIFYGRVFVNGVEQTGRKGRARIVSRDTHQ